MKRKISFVIVFALGLTLALSACGKSKPTGADTTQETGNPSAESDIDIGVPNPWRDVTEEEAQEVCDKLFKAPEGARNIAWSIMDPIDVSDEAVRPLVQLGFSLEGLSFTARAQQGVKEEEDISGMYYTWDVTEDIILTNWGMGGMPGKIYRYNREKETAELCTWYDAENRIAYSLSVSAPDLDGFDIQAVAEALNGEADDYFASGPMDISDCDTFTQIVDKLENGRGYANAVLEGTDVLLVSSGTYDNEGVQAAIDAEIFSYDSNGKPQYSGYVGAGGTAYPLAVKDGMLYAGGNHFVRKWTVKDGALILVEAAQEVFDEEGNATQYHQDEEQANYAEVPDDSELTRLFDELMDAEVIEFTAVVK
ncbi:MAG: hypothetical protein IJU50_03915 [Lachnospiraceae bacterium]|nr:hypothetical protein [Lachnospiraceae bacterium]